MLSRLSFNLTNDLALRCDNILQHKHFSYLYLCILFFFLVDINGKNPRNERTDVARRNGDGKGKFVYLFIIFITSPFLRFKETQRLLSTFTRSD